MTDEDRSIAPEPAPGSGRPEVACRSLAAASLSPADVCHGIAIRDWLMLEERFSTDPGGTIARLGLRLNAVDIPVDRLSSAIDLLHSEVSAISRFWVKGEGIRSSTYAYTDDDSAYTSSPYYVAHRERRWVELDLRDPANDVFGIVPELRAAGFTHYICVPVLNSKGAENGVTLATRSPAGFSDRDKALLRFVMPAISALIEIRSAWRQLDDVLRIYVGDDPMRAIVGGAIRRGQMTRIRAAILVADMRGYTSHTFGREPEEIVTALNVFFDCLVPPIESGGGEVLKYMGDGLLAIFRDGEDGAAGSAARALAAARSALERVAVADGSGRAGFPLAAGIGLHHGEASYGNVGSGVRLDFTVIGSDVNVASRIAGLNRPLGEPLLLSQSFAVALGGACGIIGEHAVPGLPLPLTLFRPPPPGADC